jgi:glycosyltransferase involved in cell wall biosynthesis
MNASHNVGIIIPTYNRSKLLDLTLNSILSQNFEMNRLEVIVVDDGSSDNTEEIIKKYSNQLTIKYLFQHDQGNRVSLARNMGIENSEADILIFTDPGVLLDVNCVREHVNTHLNNSDCASIGFVYGFGYEGDEDLTELEKLLKDKPLGDVFNYLRRHEKFQDMREPVYKKCKDDLQSLQAPWALFLTCNVALTRKTLDEVGYFDERYDQNWGVEDLDLGFRLFKSNVPFYLSRRAISIHIPHDHESDVEAKFEEEKTNKRHLHEKFPSIETQLLLECRVEQLNDRLEAHAKKIQYHEL